MVKKGSKLKIIPLGGLNEVGKNMTVFEYKDDIIIVDCGSSFPNDDMLGIDRVIPDITYLLKNKTKIRAIVVTHGHEDHIGALPYILKEINVPLYGTKLALALVEKKLKEHKLLSDVQMNIVSPKDIIKLGKFSVEFIKTSHSIADAVSLAIDTPLGKVIHTGDFKIDYTPIDEDSIDLHRFAELGKEGVIALLADSTNAEIPGYTMSERTVGKTFENIFKNIDTRIIVATFASHIHRVQQIINAAYIFNRRVAFSGRSMINVANIAIELGYLKTSEGMIIDINDINKYPDNEIVVITTGSQGEPMSALSRMASSEHRKIDIHNDDVVIISATPIPGNEIRVSNVINLLYQKGAHVIYESLADVHVSGHACQEELKLIHSLIKPKYFIPVHGEYKHLKSHASIAETLGMSSKNIFVTDNGKIIEISEENAKISGTVNSSNVLVDGLGVGDVGNIVLRDRKHLSEDGLIIIVVSISKKDGSIISGPDIVSRGFVYVRESEGLIRGAKLVVREALKKCEENNIMEWAILKAAIRDALKEYLYERTKRRPMILPIITEV